jgi:hypothetical protein
VISLVIPRTAKYTAQDILADYLRMIGRDTISFPLSEHAGHLYVRFGNKSFDYMDPLDMHNYEKPNSYRLEPVIQLTRGEEQKLAQYFRNATDNSQKTLGDFEYDGTYNTRGSLKNNKCRGRAGHNCTTWISTAPIGPDQQKLLELVGGTVKQDIGANPGWWSGFLNTKAKKSRVPFSVFFSANTNLKDTLKKVPDGGELVWDFSPH